jgi:hypothetical protein
MVWRDYFIGRRIAEFNDKSVGIEGLFGTLSVITSKSVVCRYEKWFWSMSIIHWVYGL